jgi:hypothetical protein
MRHQTKERPVRDRGMTLVDESQHTAGVIALGMFIVCLAFYVVLPMYADLTGYESFNLLLVPLMFLGVYGYLRGGRWYLVIVSVAAIAAVAYLFPDYMTETVLLAMGIEGIAVGADIIGRSVFYRVLRIIEYINIREKPRVKDRAVRFIFNIPRGLDTRYISMDSGISRKGIAWGEMLRRYLMALFFSMFAWIFMMANPDYDTFNHGSVDAILIVMAYFVIVVQSVSAFETLRVRAGPENGALMLYDGLVSTMVRMILPMAVATVLIAVIQWSGTYVLTNVAFTAIVLLALTILASEAYYVSMENPTVSEILAKRREFLTVDLSGGLDGEEKRKVPPGTPRRDFDSCFERSDRR